MLSSLRLATLALVLLGCNGSTSTNGVAVPSPRTDVAAPPSGEITAGNLLESERHWPYRVMLETEWTPAGREHPLSAGARGVLIRVEPAGARIDFGRDGLHQVPIEVTDLVEQANRLRSGEQTKAFPNLAHAIGPRILDPFFAPARPFSAARAAEFDQVLCVFADPSTEQFEALAEELSSMPQRAGLLTVLFPQGKHSDVSLHKQLHALSWAIPFVRDHLSEAYTRTLVPDDSSLPMVMLQSIEGRLLFESPWNDGVVSGVLSALEEDRA